MLKVVILPEPVVISVKIPHPVGIEPPVNENPIKLLPEAWTIKPALPASPPDAEEIVPPTTDHCIPPISKLALYQTQYLILLKILKLYFCYCLELNQY